MNRLMLDLNAAIGNLPMLESAIIISIAVILAWASAVATFMLLLRD